MHRTQSRIMPSRRPLLAAVTPLISFALGILLPINNAIGEEEKQYYKNTHPQKHLSSPCRLYLADSSIPNSGLGIYSGISIPKGAIATDTDFVIGITDYSTHHPEEETLAKHYWWNAHTAGAEFMGSETNLLIPSFGMLANSHLGLVNTQMEMDEDDKLERLRRDSDPGRGAVSDFHIMMWRATKDIMEGEEIFVDYGEPYFFHREEDWNVTISTSDDFEKADETAKAFHNAISNNGDCETSDTTLQELWDLIRSLSPERTRAALPSTVTDVPRVNERGSARLPLRNDVRSVEWLATNGLCLDNLGVKTSTLPGAGRGAFATRFVPEGGLVAPAPLVHIKKSVLDMFELELLGLGTGDPKKKGDVVVGKQLLLNYCFGHAASEILLFPYSPAVQLINHKRRDYNAEIRWSESPYHHSDWLETSVDELFLKHHAGLMLEVVATRDIFPGEEVFINYGEDWEKAWNRHVSEWVPEEVADTLILPEHMNKNLTAPFKTVIEQRADPYPSRVQTACYYYIPDLEIDWDERRREARQRAMVGQKPVVGVDWLYKGEYENKYLRPCDIVLRETEDDGSFEYKVRMYNHAYTEEKDTLHDDEIHMVTNVLHEGIRFIEKPFSNDQFLENAFRHYIGIPDDIFPKAWIAEKDTVIL